MSVLLFFFDKLLLIVQESVSVDFIFFRSLQTNVFNNWLLVSLFTIENEHLMMPPL